MLVFLQYFCPGKRTGKNEPTDSCIRLYLHPHWEIGIMTDIELGEYVFFEKDLNREYAILLTAMVIFNLTKHINFFAGGGMEFEKHKNLGIIRLGGKYVFRLPKSWVILPGFFFDFKEATDTWSLSVAIGKEF